MGHDTTQIDDEVAHNFDLTCKLAISAALNNLLVMAKNDSNPSCHHQEGSLYHAFYHITARWYKEEGGNDQDHVEESHPRDDQSQVPLASSSDSLFARHCHEWQGVFFQNALMMQLNRFGLFCAPHTAAIA